MDLKDLVISTLAEIEEVVKESDNSHNNKISKAAPFIIEQHEEHVVAKKHDDKYIEPMQTYQRGYTIDEDDGKTKSGAELANFLVNLKERVLVLFEGLQTIDSTSSKDLLLSEKKLDLTINFLEYLLASIDEKLEHPSK